MWNIAHGKKISTRTSLKKQADLVDPCPSRASIFKDRCGGRADYQAGRCPLLRCGQTPEYLSRGLVGHGVDLAASRSSRATSRGRERRGALRRRRQHLRTWQDAKIFVRPNPFHKKVQVYQLIDHLRSLFRDYTSSYFYVEANGMQKVVVDELIRALLP